MNITEWLALQHGDLIQHAKDGRPMTVVDNHKHLGIIVLRAELASNPEDWTLVLKNSKYKPGR